MTPSGRDRAVVLLRDAWVSEAVALSPRMSLLREILGWVWSAVAPVSYMRWWVRQDRTGARARLVAAGVHYLRRPPPPPCDGAEEDGA